MGTSFKEVLERCNASLEDTRRRWSSFMLTQFPDEGRLRTLTEGVRDRIGSDAVQVNAIYENMQITLAAAPAAYCVTVPVKDSLCVMAVGNHGPLAIDDIENSPIVKDHPARQAALGAWASVPISVNGCDAGAVCALEWRKRRWGRADEAELQRASLDVGRMVDSWIRSWSGGI